MRAPLEPATRQAVVIGAFDRVEGLRCCLDALRADGVPADGLTLIAHEQHAPGSPARPGAHGEPSHALAHEALIGGVLQDYLAGWGGLALVSIPGFGPAVGAGGARTAVADRLAAALAGPREGDAPRAELLEALAAGSWLLVAHGDDELLAAAERCFARGEASRVERLEA